MSVQVWTLPFRLSVFLSLHWHRYLVSSRFH